MARVCPRCGRRGGEAGLIGPLCRDCYVEVYGLARLPPAVDFEYCALCGAYRLSGGWNEGLGSVEETLREYLVIVLSRKLRPTEHVEEAWVEGVELLEPHGPGIRRVRVRVGGRSGVVVAREDRVVGVNVRPSVCPVCASRRTARGYEAVVQVRSSSGRMGERLRRSVEEVLLGLDTRLREAIVGVEERREGIDLLVLDQSSARLIASKIRAAMLGKTVETYKLVGRRPDGSRKGRLTVSVRLPDIEPGDLVDVGGRPSLYLARTRGGALFVDLGSGREVVYTAEDLWGLGFERHPGGPELRRLMLLSKEGGSMVFLDVDKGYQDVIEVPRGLVRDYSGGLREGEEYLAYLAGRRIYIIRRAPGDTG